jgi:hypothetical protein
MQPGFQPFFPPGAVMQQPPPGYALAQQQPLLRTNSQPSLPGAAPASADRGWNPPARVVRGQSAEEPAPVRISRTIAIPSPEQAGVAAVVPATAAGVAAPAAAAPEFDWNNAYRRLRALNADFQLCKHQAGFRFTCLMPTSQPGRIHRVEAEAGSEAEAVRLTLERAEQWARGQ